MEIKFEVRTGEIVNMKEQIGDIEFGELESRIDESDDPFEVVAHDMFESEELHYVKWMEIDGERKNEPFDYEWHVPRWWENKG